MARNANVTFTLTPPDTRHSVCRQKRAEHGGKCGMLTSPLVHLVCAGLNPPRSEERRRWRQPRSDLVMTANDAEGMGRTRRHRSMAIPPLERRLPFRPAEMLLGNDRVRGGVLQLQDMRNVYQNCILASALCFDLSLQDHFPRCRTGQHRGQCDPLSNIAGSLYITFV